MNVLVDTPVWSLALRRIPENLNREEQKIVAELSELSKEGRIRIIGPIRQELLSGIRLLEQYEKLRTSLSAFRDEPLSTPDYEEAAKAGNRCRAQGITVTSVDILICAVALSRSFHIFTTDHDFHDYASVLPIKLHAPRR
jgi:predicted nucleic acid-binding protein